MDHILYDIWSIVYGILQWIYTVSLITDAAVQCSSLG